jgi:proteic killer suppression protein
VIRSFGDEATYDVFMGRATKAARRLPMSLWPVIVRKLRMLEVAVRLGDLREPPANRLEALKGDRAGSFNIRVNDQYRVTFRWEGHYAEEVRVEDYHA